MCIFHNQSLMSESVLDLVADKSIPLTTVDRKLLAVGWDEAGNIRVIPPHCAVNRLSSMAGWINIFWLLNRDYLSPAEGTDQRARNPFSVTKQNKDFVMSWHYLILTQTQTRRQREEKINFHTEHCRKIKSKTFIFKYLIFLFFYMLNIFFVNSLLHSFNVSFIYPIALFFSHCKRTPNEWQIQTAGGNFSILEILTHTPFHSSVSAPPLNEAFEWAFIK